MLSAMFRQQVVEYESAVNARDAVFSELSKVQNELREKNTKTMYKEKQVCFRGCSWLLDVLGCSWCYSQLEGFILPKEVLGLGHLWKELDWACKK